MVMAIPGVTGTTTGAGKTKQQIDVEYGKISASNAKALATGKEINASRNSGAAIAASAQALANQTGGNILGFTYE
jgi:hypothetical protein